MQRTRPAKVNQRRDRRPRRNNAPIRPGRGPALLPAVILALGLCALTMAVIVFASSFVDVAGQAGGELARLFAAALLATGLFTFALGLGLTGHDRPAPGEAIYPMVVGIVIGAFEAALLIAPALPLVPAPVLLLVLLIAPIRHRIERMASPTRGFPG